MTSVAIDHAFAQSVAFAEWVRKGTPGSMYLDVDDRLYVMTYFGHRRIEDKAVSLALTHRDRMFREKVLRNQTVLRTFCLVTLIELLSLVGLLIWY